MRISVVMLIYKESINELKQSISSILNQTYQNFEFIIINNNPKSSFLKRFLNYEKKEDSRIIVINNSHNYGVIRSANEAIKLANGKYIARMDADDICNKNRLMRQLSFIRFYKLDMVCSNFCGFDNIKIDHPYYGNKCLINQYNVKDILRYCNFAIGPTMFFKKKSFNKVGGYRKILCEDYDLVCRFIINKYRVGYQPNILLYKRNHLNNISNENSIYEFLVSYMIRKYIKEYSYHKELPLNIIKIKMNNLDKNDVNKFRLFQDYFMKFKDKKSIINLVKLIVNVLSSQLLLKDVFSLCINKLNKSKV